MTEIMSPRTACRYLREIRDERQQFQTKDGKSIKSLIELVCYLKVCQKETFDHHVSPSHNHFSSWVGHVVLDRDLAGQMSLVLDKNPMRIIVMKRVNILVHNATRTPRGRDMARMILEDALLPEELFITIDGRTIRNLWELREFLEKSDEKAIAYHLSPIRNDFYSWVSEVIMDFELAEAMLRASGKTELSHAVAKRLDFLMGFGETGSSKHDLSFYAQKVHEHPQMLHGFVA
jgi:hypothetical protein